MYKKTRKKGEVPQLSRRFGDVDNRVKPLLDAVFKYLKADDVFIRRMCVSKNGGSAQDQTSLLVQWEGG